MEHLQIAYDLIVIVIGFAALSIALSWANRTGEPDLWNFSLTYGLFALILVTLTVKKYLFLNVDSYSTQSWYLISGALQLVDFAVVVAMIHFFLEAYQIRARRALMSAALVLMVISLALVVSPFGAVLDAHTKTIRLGVGFQVASGWYFLSFTLAVVLGYGGLHRVWKTDKWILVTGLLIFATVGYVEVIFGLLHQMRAPLSTLGTEKDFTYSSIPYALYGIFLIVYFLHYFAPTPVEPAQLSEPFLAKYGITGREREIILKVAQGKSNADIAGDLFVSIATVKTHLHNIYGKIGVNSRFELLARLRSGQ